MYPEHELSHAHKILTDHMYRRGRSPGDRFTPRTDREQMVHDLRWLQKHDERIWQLIGQAYLDAHQEKPRPWTDEDAALVEGALSDLDQTPAGPTARKTFLPMWPMTMAQLRQMATKTNPTPFKKKEKIRPHGSAALYPYVPERPDLTRIALEQAWKRASPEGFPPYPRREGKYSESEQSGIVEWLANVWEPVQEAREIAKEADRRLIRSGIDAWKVRFMMPDSWEVILDHKVKDLFRTRSIYATGQKSKEDYFAADHTPKELLENVLRWAPQFLALVDMIRDFDPSIFRKQSDPDAHMDRIQYPLEKQKIAHIVYGLSDRHEDWTEKFSKHGARRVPPVQLLGDYPLSRLLAAQEKARSDKAAEDAAREQRESAAKEVARAALQKMVDRGLSFSRPNIQRALPDHKLEFYHGVLRLIDPKGVQAAYGNGKDDSITAGLHNLAANLGVKVP
jgi:hypothetical protein